MECIRGNSYSAVSLIKKLGIKEGFALYIKNSPINYSQLLGRMPKDATVKPRLAKGLDFVHCFVNTQKELAEFLPKAKAAISANGMIWISWPKKASKVNTDLSEDVIRRICLPLDLVDVKVCAIDNMWSGLKLVIRKEKRN